MSELQGGKFGSGFLAAGLSAGVGGIMNGSGWTGIDPSDVIGRTAIAAALGGTVSEITGGKFANGAITGAFTALAHSGSQAARANPRDTGFTPGVCDSNGNNCRPFTAEERVWLDSLVADVSIQATAAGSAFAGIYGVSISRGALFDPMTGKLCQVTTVCMQFGVGAYFGWGGELAGDVAKGAVGSGRTESWGIFGNVGAFGASTGGSINFSKSGAGAAKGFWGGQEKELF